MRAPLSLIVVGALGCASGRAALSLQATSLASPVADLRPAALALVVPPGPPVVELRTVVTFDPEGHVVAVCSVLMRADSSQLFAPFADAALAPLASVGARCTP